MFLSLDSNLSFLFKDDIFLTVFMVMRDCYWGGACKERQLLLTNSQPGSKATQAPTTTIAATQHLCGEFCALLRAIPNCQKFAMLMWYSWAKMATFTHSHTPQQHTHAHIYVDVCVNMYMHVCICIYIYICLTLASSWFKQVSSWSQFGSSWP